ncbi:carboxypeptidase-like regulatory domain-containing protein [Segetibacter sp. 3557_3]|uniref:carboxypeptidase-like regulatory domain-containing protein n=1 Tax=Segetibacter sp. 3557_3 TaxID=2547429 RepID=UPI00140426E6|nr:carboxypeptidase-like regulatory domain-containing protein [Segetibacter sp. 3557_3]
MKMLFTRFLPALCLVAILTACTKSVEPSTSGAEQGAVTGRITDEAGKPLAGIRVVIEHTVWVATYVYATTNEDGYYKAELPKDPAGSWTAKAQVKKNAYGQQYTFDLHPATDEPFTRNDKPVRDFTWKLSGPRPGTAQVYGAHVDVYQWGLDIPMTGVKLVFTPVAGETLADGTAAKLIERNVVDHAGTFMARDIPIGKYTVRAVYPGKTLLLDNRKDNGEPEVQKTVVFGKNGYLAETEYNIEFWLSE